MAITDPNWNPWSAPLEELKQAAFPPAPQAPQKPVELQELDKAFADFKAAATDYRHSTENFAALVPYLDNVRQGRMLPNAEDFKQAHALATYHNRYSKEPAPAQVDPQNAWEAPIEQLRDAAFPSGIPEEWSMEMTKLKKAAGLE